MFSPPAEARSRVIKAASIPGKCVYNPAEASIVRDSKETPLK